MALLLTRPRPATTETSRAAAAPAPAARPKPSRRNVAIDVLRGYCIVMMIGSHVGTYTHVNNALHLLRFVSGAEGFVFLSGLVLGMVYRRKLDAGPTGEAYRAIWRRARMLWVVHCVSVAAALTLNQFFVHYGDLPDARSLGLWRAVWLTATLRLQPGHMLNILPMYVVFLGAAPACLELLRRGRAPLLLCASAAVFAYYQWSPDMAHWADLSVSAGDAFPPVAWQVLFVPGLCVGYHHAAIRNALVGPHRARLRWGLALACALVCAVLLTQTPTFQFYDHAAWDAFLWERHPLRFGRVLYFFLIVSAAYLLAQAWWNRPRLPRFPLTFLATLGRNSLYAFLTHLIIAFGVGALPLTPDRWLLAEATTVACILSVYLLARHQVGRKWIPN